jgi:hypothetical protein
MTLSLGDNGIFSSVSRPWILFQRGRSVSAAVVVYFVRDPVRRLLGLLIVRFAKI